MKLRQLSKRQNSLEFQLRSEDHTFANLVKELAWKHGGEAAYRMEHPLLGEPKVKVISDEPKKVLQKVAKDIVGMSKKVEKAFSK